MRTTRTRILLTALIAAVVLLAQAAPATAESASGLRQKRDAARARRAAIAAKLDAARASDQQLSTAVANLDNAVRAQVSATDAAQQALSASEVSVRQAETRLNATQQRVGQLKSRAVDSALQAYMHAGGHTLIDIVQARNLNDLSRRETFVKQLVANDRDVLDQLRSAQQDQAAEQAKLGKARDVTKARRKDAGAKLKDLAGQLKTQARLRGAMNDRIAEYAAEAEAVASEEGNIQKLLNVAQGGDTGPASAAGLIWPCRGPLTSGFGMRWGRMHQGQDIACGYGTPIHAAKAGTVVFAGVMSGYGNVIIIDHGGGFSTLYAHQSSLAASQGQHVNQGDVIGYVGSTGHSTGPHLHFETRFGGNPRNPMPYLP
jgi:murein DD-endopeptidase MepM/ murein hydrolase activator NlpD